MARTVRCALPMLAVAVLSAGWALPAAADVTLTVATVNNDNMVVMQKLSPAFEASHPGVHLHWVVLMENTLREQVTADVTSGTATFDVVTIGNYEVPIWAKRQWLAALPRLPESYDLDDLLKPVRKALSYGGKLYALPFYGESAMTYYRTDLFDKAGLKMPEHPSYDEIRGFADKITDKPSQIYGMCLRGKPGWGENMATITALVNAFGGQWFDTDWDPMLDTAPWQRALGYYDDVLKADGPPDVTDNGFNKTLALFSTAHCGIWIDSTVAAGLLYDKTRSSVADTVGYAPMPTGADPTAPTWLWSWNLAIPASSKKKSAAVDFLTWATSKDYIALVGKTNGWVSVPPGTRRSTYDNPEYQKAAPFGRFVEQAIETANPVGQTAAPRPYTGAQFVAIPEFQKIGADVGRTMAATLTGQMTIDQALHAAQWSTEETMQQAGYPK